MNFLQLHMYLDTERKQADTTKSVLRCNSIAAEVVR